MPVKFISHVEENKDNEWFITLTDTLENESIICKNLDEYKIKLEELSANYGYDINVVWSKSKSLSIKSIEELNQQMALLQEEYKNEIENINKEK